MANVTTPLFALRFMPLTVLLTFGAVVPAQPIPQAPGAEAAPRKAGAAHPMKEFKLDPAYPDPYWGTATPAEARVNAAGLDAAVARIAEKGWEIHGMVVARNGKIVFERYGWKTGQNADDPDKSQHQVLPNERHLMHSTTKSVTSALFGIALHDGLVPGGLEARAVSFFPEWQPLPNASPEKDSIRIVDLLTMRSGLQYQEGQDDQAIFIEPQSPTHAYLSRPVVDLPVGTKWNYSSASSGVLAAILQKVTGMSPKQYAVEKLFTPLGIVDPPWAAGKDGIQHGGWGLELTTREMARSASCTGWGASGTGGRSFPRIGLRSPPRRTARRPGMGNTATSGGFRSGFPSALRLAAHTGRIHMFARSSDWWLRSRRT